MSIRQFSLGWMPLGLLGIAVLSGCGGEEEGSDTVAQAPASPAPAAAAPASGGGEDDGYGGEGYGAGQGYGGEGYGAGQGYGDEGEDSDEDPGGYGYPGMSQSDGGGYGGDAPGEGYGAGMGDGGYGGPGYDGGGMGGYGGPGYDGDEDGYGGYGGPGYGGGMAGGPGGAAPTGFALANQFVRQNCAMCHLGRASRGEVSLVGLSPDINDPHSVELFQSVLGVLADGSMPPANRPRPNPTQKQEVVSWIQETFGSIKRDLLASAQRSFATGKESEAVDLLYAHVLSASAEESAQILSQTRWFAANTRPTTVVRFATGVILEAPSTLTDVKPIGVSQRGGGGGGGGGYGGGEYGGGGPGGLGGGGRGGESTQRTFQSLTGEFGDLLVAAFESRWAAGDLGTVFNEVVVASGSGGRAGGGGFGAPASGGRGMMGDQGMGGGGFGGGYGGEDGGYGAGYGGPGYGGGESGYGGPGYGGGDSAASGSSRDSTLPGGSIVPGMLYLGVGSKTELLAKAATAGVDGVFIFDVEAKQNLRMQIVNNETRLSLVMTDGKAVGATRTLKNTEVEMARMRGTGDDDVQKNIDRLFKNFDEKIKLASMPSLKPEHARARMAQLLSNSELSRMSKLFEAKLFHSMSLLSDEELSMAYQIILEGNEGEVLANGTEDDRGLVMELTLEEA